MSLIADAAEVKINSILYLVTLYALADFSIAANAYYHIYEHHYILNAPQGLFVALGSASLAAVVFSRPGIPGFYKPPLFAFVFSTAMMSSTILGLSAAELLRKNHADAPPLVFSLAKTLCTSLIATAMAYFRLWNPQKAIGIVGTLGTWASIILALVYVDFLITASFEHHIGASHYILGLSATEAIITAALFAGLIAMFSVLAVFSNDYLGHGAAALQATMAFVLLTLSIYQAAYAERDTPPMYAAIRSTLSATFFLAVFSPFVLVREADLSRPVYLAKKTHFHVQ